MTTSTEIMDEIRRLAARLDELGPAPVIHNKFYVRSDHVASEIRRQLGPMFSAPLMPSLNIKVMPEEYLPPGIAAIAFAHRPWPQEMQPGDMVIIKE